MKIWLFCNEGYGLPYLEDFLRYCKKNHVQYEIVISAKNYINRSPNNTFTRLIKNVVIKSIIKIQLLWKYKTNILVISDINELSLYKKVSSRDYGIVAGFNQIFKKKILDQFKLIVNFHPSLLPYYRGPVPSYWCIKYGEITSGYSLHLLTENIDSGKILFQETVEIKNINDEHMVDIAIAKEGAKCMRNLLDSWLNKTEFQNCLVDAEKIYIHHIGYQSFPKNDKFE